MTRRRALSVLAAGAVAVVLAHAMPLGYRTYANVDEGYASALASRLLDGFELYVGAVSQRGPLMYRSFEAFAALHGWDAIGALRAWALAFALAHVLLVYLAARVLFRGARSVAAVAAAAAAYALAVGMPGEDALALNGESLQVPAVIVGALLGAAALAHFPREVAAQRRRARKVRALLFGAGVAFGAAIAVKQSAALHPAVVAAFVVLRAGRAGRTWRGYAGEIAALAIGTLLVPAAFVAHAASRGTLGALFYYTVTYNAEVHLQPGSASHPWLTPLFVRLATGTLLPLALVVLAVGRALPFLVRRVRARSPWRGWGVRAYVASHLVVATISAASLVRFFPHYFLVALPFLALSLGAALAPVARRQPAVLAGFVTFLVGFAALTCTFREKVDGRVSHDRAVQQVAAYVQATTRAEDRVFVWGFSPWIYGYAHRRPAGRYVFATYPTGFVPWFWAPLEEERARAVPGSMQALLDDLAREKPAVVVDAGSVMIARPLRAYPEMAAWLGEGFCFAVRVGAYDVYARRPADGSACAASGFPRPHSAVDMFGRPLRVPLPPTVDAAITRAIDEDESRYYEPRWFDGDPAPPEVDAARATARGFDFDPWGLLAP